MSTDYDLIIVTDLDGSLLDHHTYRWDEAQPALDKLQTLEIPVILNSSKTAAELKALKQSLNNREPFIAENGAGVLIPPDYFSRLNETLPHSNGFLSKTFGIDLSAVTKKIHRLREHMKIDFQGFSDMSVDQLMELTGLTKANAQMALQRDFTEPVIWHDTDAAWDVFSAALSKEQISTHRGGRFIHLSGGGDKGKALIWLRDAYATERQKPIKVIALGDGENDLPMLAVADFPVIIRSPVNPLPVLPNRDDAIITDATGPAGWNAAVLEILKKTGKD